MSNFEKPQKIFVSLDDSIPYVLDLVVLAQTKHIILVVEENSGILSTLVSMKVLLKELIKLDKITIVQTKDNKASHFGSQVGLIVVNETNQITPELWMESERAADTFKTIYALRKEELAAKRNVETTKLNDNLSELWSKSLNEPTSEDVNFEEVIDLPIISSTDEKNEPVSLKAKPHKKVGNPFEQPHRISDKKTYQLENGKQEPIIELDSDNKIENLQKNNRNTFVEKQSQFDRVENKIDTKKAEDDFSFEQSEENPNFFHKKSEKKLKTPRETNFEYSEFEQDLPEETTKLQDAIFEETRRPIYSEPITEFSPTDTFSNRNSKPQNSFVNTIQEKPPVENKPSAKEIYLKKLYSPLKKTPEPEPQKVKLNLKSDVEIQAEIDETRRKIASSILHNSHKLNIHSEVVNPGVDNIQILKHEAKRPSFEELYRQMKEKRMAKSPFVPQVDKQVEANFQPQNKKIIYSKRYSPKLIRTSGLVIAPGGDITNFAEVQDEIVRDDFVYANHFHKIPQDTKIKKRITREGSRPNANFAQKKTTFMTDNKPISKINSTQIPSEISKFENLNVQEVAFQSVPIKTKLSDIYSKTLNFTNTKLKSLKATLTSKRHEEKSVGRMVNRQKIPIDRLEKKETPHSTFKPIDRRKLARNTLGGLGIFLVIFISWALITFYFFINAEIVLAVNPVPVSTSKTINLEIKPSSLISNSDTQNTLVAEKMAEVAELGETKNTTTTKDLGSKAEGDITLYNKTDADILLTKGSKASVVVSSKQLNFFLKNDITVPKRVVKTIRTDNGFTDARYIAENTGEQSNLSADLLGEVNRFQIDGYASSQLEGIGFSSFNGGKTNIVKIISQTDLDELKKNIEEKLKLSIEEKLISKFSEDYEIINKPEFSILLEEFTGKVDAQADKVDLFMKIEGKIIVVNKKSIKKSITEMYETEKNKVITADYVPIQTDFEKWEYNYKILGVNGEVVELQINITGKIIPPVSEEEIIKTLLGKSVDEVETNIANTKNVKLVKYKLTPEYLPEFAKIFPQNSDRINLIFEKVEM